MIIGKRGKQVAGIVVFSSEIYWSCLVRQGGDKGKGISRMEGPLGYFNNF